ncbi:DUF2254 domain-containing protein [soil metagenome]
MVNRIISFWIGLRASLWFIPGLMIAASVVLALLLVELESTAAKGWTSRYPLLFGVGVDGSRGMLTAIASSMLTVAALVFTLTLNAVNEASGQFTPRIFRNFLRDRANQFVLGYFVSVFAYCLVVLRTIRSGDEVNFVPSVAVVMGLFLALGGTVVLIFFIHHIAASLQISNIIGEIVDETKKGIQRLFPDEVGSPISKEGEDIAEIADDAGKEDWIKVVTEESGYIQLIDVEDLAEFAADNACVVRMEAAVGEFVGTGSRLVSVLQSAGHKLDADKLEELKDLFGIARDRTIEQDVGFGIRQLVDIALKALSPGVNDTTTAINCIENLGELIGELASREFPQRVRVADGKNVFIVKSPSFADFVGTAFDQIRISGKANAAVFMKLASAIELAAERTDSKSRLSALRSQLILTAEYAEMTLEMDNEKKRVGQRIEQVLHEMAAK